MLAAALAHADHSTDVERLRELANHSHDLVLQAVALNPASPADVLNRLADHALLWVVVAVAQNPHTPGDALRRIADTRTTASDRRLPFALLANSNTPTDVLDRFILASPADGPRYVESLADLRTVAGSNPNLSVDSMRILVAISEEPFDGFFSNEVDKELLGAALAGNRNLPTDLARQLAAHPAARVRNALKERDDIDDDTRTLLALAQGASESS